MALRRILTPQTLAETKEPSETKKSPDISISIGNNLFLVASPGKVTRCHQTLEGDGTVSYLPDSGIYQVDEAKATPHQLDLPQTYATMKFFPFDAQRVLFVGVDTSGHRCDVLLISHNKMEHVTASVDTTKLLTTATAAGDLTDVQIEDVVLVNRDTLYFLVSDEEFANSYSHYVFEFHFTIHEKEFNLKFDKSSYMRGFSKQRMARMWHPMCSSQDLLILRYNTDHPGHPHYALQAYIHPTIHNQELSSSQVFRIPPHISPSHIDSTTILPLGFVGFIEEWEGSFFPRVINLAYPNENIATIINEHDKVYFKTVAGKFFLEIHFHNTDKVEKIPLDALNKLLLQNVTAAEQETLNVCTGSLYFEPINVEQSRFIHSRGYETSLIDIGEIGEGPVSTPASMQREKTALPYYDTITKSITIPGVSKKYFNNVDLLHLGNENFIVNLAELSLIVRGKLATIEGNPQILIDLTYPPVSHRMWNLNFQRYDDNTVLAFPKNHSLYLSNPEIFQINVTTMECRKVKNSAFFNKNYAVCINHDKKIYFYSDKEIYQFILETFPEPALTYQSQLQFDCIDSIDKILPSAFDSSLIVRTGNQRTLYHVKVKNKNIIETYKFYEGLPTHFLNVLPTGHVIFCGRPDFDCRNIQCYDQLTRTTEFISHFERHEEEMFLLRQSQIKNAWEVFLSSSKGETRAVKLNINPHRDPLKESKRVDAHTIRMFDITPTLKQTTEIETKQASSKELSKTQKPVFKWAAANQFQKQDQTTPLNEYPVDYLQLYSSPWQACNASQSHFFNINDVGNLCAFDFNQSPIPTFYKYTYEGMHSASVLIINEDEVLITSDEHQLLHYKINFEEAEFQLLHACNHQLGSHPKLIGKLANTVLCIEYMPTGLQNQIDIYFFDIESKQTDKKPSVLSAQLFHDQSNAVIQSAYFSDLTNLVHVFCIKENKPYLIEFFMDCEEVALVPTNEFILPTRKAVRLWQPTIENHVIIAHEIKENSAYELVLYEKINNKLQARYVIGTVDSSNLEKVSMLPLGQIMLNGTLFKMETRQYHRYITDSQDKIAFVRATIKQCHIGIRSTGDYLKLVTVDHYDDYTHLTKKTCTLISLYTMLSDTLHLFSLDIVKMIFDFALLSDPSKLMVRLPATSEVDFIHTINRYIKMLDDIISRQNIHEYHIRHKILKRLLNIISSHPEKTYSECLHLAESNLQGQISSSKPLSKEIDTFLDRLTHRLRPYCGTDYVALEEQMQQTQVVCFRKG